jgi:hypothetical protein
MFPLFPKTLCQVLNSLYRKGWARSQGSSEVPTLDAIPWASAEKQEREKKSTLLALVGSSQLLVCAGWLEGIGSCLRNSIKYLLKCTLLMI